MANRFKEPTLRAQYDAAMHAFTTKHRNLFDLEGNPKLGGSSFAEFFWKGYNGQPVQGLGIDRQFKTTLAYAYYRAGQDAAIQSNGQYKASK